MNKANSRRVSPLYNAATENHASMAGMLLDAAANANYGDEDGSTPLMMAAQEGYEAVLATLLRAGPCEVDKTKGVGTTALSIAAANGHAAVVARLLQAGAAVDKADGEGATPLMEAARAGHRAVVQYYCKVGEGAPGAPRPVESRHAKMPSSES